MLWFEIQEFELWFEIQEFVLWLEIHEVVICYCCLRFERFEICGYCIVGMMCEVQEFGDMRIVI